jgi:hypothetical protein
MTEANSNITTLPVDKAPRKHRSTRRVTERVPRKASQLAISKASQAGRNSARSAGCSPRSTGLRTGNGSRSQCRCWTLGERPGRGHPAP